MFIEEYLQDLRRERFAPAAIALYVRRAAARARESLVANPGAARSLWSLGLLFFAACFVVSVAMALWDERRLALELFLCTTLTMVPVFVLVTLHLDLLRDREGYRLSAVNLPTALTLLRLCMAPGIALFLAQHHFALALGAFLVAEFSDVADGWLARRLKQITRLGTVLDPIVDIVFNVVVFNGLFLSGLLPLWVLGAALLRYGIFLLGGAGLYVFVGPVTIQPTFFGRLSGVVMVGLVALLMLLHVLHPTWVERLAPLTIIALGALLVAAVGQVVALGWYNLRVMQGAATAQGRVVGDVRWGPR
jgi:cardiolipin synthase (CMP-forming)